MGIPAKMERLLRSRGLPALLISFTIGQNRENSLGFNDSLTTVREYQLTTDNGPDVRPGPSNTNIGSNNIIIQSTESICVICSRAFTTKTGLGVHVRRAHPDELDRRRQEQRVDVKVRWSEEEVQLMAKKEAELVKCGKRFLNVELATIFPNRSPEAIKKARQKPNYKVLVSNHLEQNIHLNETLNNGIHIGEEYGMDNCLIEYILNMPQLPNIYNSDTLLSIANDAHNLDKTATLNRLAAYLVDIFPGNRHDRPPKQLILQNYRNNRERRRQEYAKTQRNFRKHQGRCINAILDGPNNASQLPKEVMLPYWRTVFEHQSLAAPSDERLEMGQELSSIWNPITVEEVITSRVELATSPGPDGITPKVIRGVPPAILTVIFNLIMWCGQLPMMLRKSKTIFIPKKAEVTEPGDFRPISIPSIVTRQLHSIIAKRISKHFCFDLRQRGFRNTDGCLDNAVLMDLLLRDHHQRNASCFIALLDVKKAFDSVSHGAILGALRSYRFPTGLIDYLNNNYNHSTTELYGMGWKSSELHPGRGVKQGDPLSPILFNIIINRLLCSLPAEVGTFIGECKVNAMAFADDLVLVASTPAGLQLLIDHTYSFLTKNGMELNRSKCLTISIEGRRKKKFTVISQRTFTVSNQTIPALKRTDEWVYLGVSFTAEGRCKVNPQQDIGEKLNKIGRAPLKPQQKLHALKTVLIPQYYHKTTLGNVMIGSLRKTDMIIRNAVRKWLHLPADAPIAFFHSPVSHGGLGIPSFRWICPWLRMRRLTNLMLPGLESSVVANTFIATEIDNAAKRLQVEGLVLKTKADIDKYWSNRLYSTTDGYGLRDSKHAPNSHRWIREPTRLLSGRDYVNCVRLRINALPTRSRTTRGRASFDRECRGGCGVPETINHVVQQCHRTHGTRIDRHNAVVKYVKRGLENRGFTTIAEPRLHTSIGLRKPDLIAILSNEAFVIDAQVVTDGRDLDDMNKTKVEKYNTEDVLRETIRISGCPTARSLAVTLNFRGIWSKESVKRLLDHKIISKSDTAVLSTRVAIGSVCAHRRFTQTTMTRTGVG